MTLDAGVKMTANCSLSPEDAGGVTVYFDEEVFDVDARGDEVVEVEAEVSVSPVQRPLVLGFGVAQPSDGESGPVGPEVRPPWRPALQDRCRDGGQVDLVADLIAGALR
jgi:hypothetical protein